MPNFIQDYLLYNAGNECPKTYHLWSAISILASTMGKRVHVDLGYMDIHPNLYLCLVGKQGFRKSTAKDIARDMFCEVFPDIPVGASVQSREDIIKFMASDESTRAYMDSEKGLVEYHPMVFFINELKNFLSINPGAMIEFLTDIYDRRYFDASTIKRGLEKIENPCINILACETPAWITDKLKLNIISGGFSRRMIYIYETVRGPKISFPVKTQESFDAGQRCMAHLKKIVNLSGRFTWTDDAKAFYDQWYQSLVFPTDEVMAGYYESKHVQLLKISMLLTLAEENPKLVLTKDTLELGVATLDAAEVNMPKLSIAAGRNEFAVTTQKILDMVEASGGMIPEKLLLREIGKDLKTFEYASVLEHLKKTDQIFHGAVTKDNVVRSCYMNRAFYEKQKGTK